MTKEEFIDKWYSYGGVRNSMKFESDLDALLKEEAVEFELRDTDANREATEAMYDNWKQLTTE